MAAGDPVIFGYNDPAQASGFTSQQHTSAPILIDPQTAIAGLNATYARIAPDWSPGQVIKAGEHRVYGGVLYRRVTDGTTGTTFTPVNWTQVNALGTPSASAFTLGPGSMSIQSGTPTTGSLTNWPTYVLPDAATSGVNVTPGITPGVEYDVYLRWAPSVATGVFILGFGSESPTEGSAMTGDSASRFMALAAGPTVNAVYRTHLNETVYVAPGNGATAFIRIDRRGADALDTNTGTFQILGLEFIPRLPIADAPVADGGTLTRSAWTTPYDGNTVWRGFGIFTPIWTSANAVYVTEAVTLGGVQQSRLAKLDKTTKAQIQDVQLLAETHDASSMGHRWGSVAVTDAGVVVAYPEHHHLPWAGKHSTSAEDLTTLTATTTPTGADVNCSYRRFARNPYNGDLWLGMRANAYNGGLYKWNPGASTWTQIKADYFTTPGQYGMEIAFGGANTIYALTEWFAFGAAPYSGYPRRGVAVVKSTDGGTTWTTISGAPLAQPIGGMKDGSEGRMAFPSPKGLYTVVAAKIAVAADGNPVVIASYHHRGEAYRSLWVAKWNPTTKDWDRRRLMANNGTKSTGNPSVIYTQTGRIIVTAAASDDHTTDDTASGGAEIQPSPQSLYLFVTDDAATWTRYTVGSTQAGVGGAYLDSEAYRIDGKVRMLAVVEDVVTTSQIWEVTLPN